MVAALNDPFLNADCIPRELAQQHPLLTLEITRSGGHVGFLNDQLEWWLDARFLGFFRFVGFLVGLRKSAMEDQRE